ncbi:MAG: hypothetical protein CSB23_04125 [Deltaproteobacteria bacterium]|nr:MAG: hypothetical protein CSB23_04125 [Deltaproteobacteria bacterium]
MPSTQNKEQTKKCNDAVGDEAILKTSKEIIIKFIETGKINPAGFDLQFRNIYTSIEKTVRNER